MTREIPCPFRTKPEDGPCESQVVVTLTDEVPAQFVSATRCRHHSDGAGQAILRGLRPVGSLNPHFVVVLANPCPWCDGTGIFAREYRKGEHECAACDTELGRSVTWVPCGWCKGTGAKSAG